MSYEINYDDKRFTEVEADKKAALTENEKTYGGIISNSDKYFQKQIDASKDWADKQTQLQNQQTDFAIQQVEQQKADAKKDYTKEQSGAYVDWQKQSDKQGVRAEQIADKGMQNTGYSESSQVSMYNTYQNRVATAREAYVRAVQNYDNAITQARLQNNSALAEIAYKALQQQLELSLQGFQYKNELLLEQANKKFQIESEYHNRYMDVLNQINTENALAEEIRQFNEQMDWEEYQFNYHNKLGEFANSGGGGGGARGRWTPDQKKKMQQQQQQIKGSKDILTHDNTGLPSDTRKSILALGQGPISEKNLAKQVNSGKVAMSTNTKTGNTIFNYAGLQTSNFLKKK